MAGEPKGDRILIVDDDDGIRELCSTTFLLEGYQVINKKLKVAKGHSIYTVPKK